MRINQIIEDFKAETSQGPLSFYDYAGDSWVLLFSHPKDFTPVCTTELATLATMEKEFAARNFKLLGLSADSSARHQEWIKDVEEVAGAAVNYPIIADQGLTLAKKLDMLPEEAVAADSRTAADNATVRTVYVVDPAKKVRLLMTYPMSTGRNFDEILRSIDSLFLTDKHKVATPSNWKKGEDVIILPSVADEQAKELFPNGWEAVKPYLRKVADPSE